MFERFGNSLEARVGQIISIMFAVVAFPLILGVWIVLLAFIVDVLSALVGMPTNFVTPDAAEAQAEAMRCR